MIGQKCGFWIKYLNGIVDVFRGWVSLLGKMVQSKDEIVCIVKIISVGCLYMVEEDVLEVVSVIGLIVELINVIVKVGVIIVVMFMVKLDNVIDKLLCIVMLDLIIVIVMQVENIVIVKGVKVGIVKIIGMIIDGNFIVIVDIIVQV